ncbi:hypothetical protein [Amycolatopsis sp. lyj-112]|uniref:hypothetical protein n=1 Tax=Amycolatopsis sp. lyj-112 TaxID=2789288 RepID=UPI00397B53AE
MSTLTIRMLKDWAGWLKEGQTYELDYSLATMLIGLKKARYHGEAINLFKGFNENKPADSQERDEIIWPT